MQLNTILSYADDTVVLSSDNSLVVAQDKMNNYLKKVAEWLAINRLSLNISKRYSELLEIM